MDQGLELRKLCASFALPYRQRLTWLKSSVDIWIHVSVQAELD